MGIRLSHLFLFVSDLERSRRFYTELLGLKVLLEENGYLRVGVPDGVHIGMEVGKPWQIGARGVEINLEVDDVDDWARRLKGQGIRLDQEPSDMPWGARHAFFQDPDGYRLSVFTPIEVAAGAA
jgi:catechol 2,3-dioxygenase-like lactoylglutathione lyase family enzyme